ncbi:NEDD4-binding protein 2-like [Uloborus diversus]|uniref:NEDD4-binding protein 2-like n=1 Tax=Uloborus diversus TaxID=327109 RepID=UPI002409377F|nr:NEDD4-binding protein 2-like [Uloborus diversus]
MPRKSKGKFKPQRINVMSNCGDAEIFRNSAAVLDDVDPCESLRYMKEIFKDKFDEDVIAMIFSECAYDVNQAYETLISLSSEDEPKQEAEASSQVLEDASKGDNCSVSTDQAGKAESYPISEQCSSGNSKLKAESSVVTIVHGGQTYYHPQLVPSKDQGIASNPVIYPDGSNWSSQPFFTPPGSSYPLPSENVCSDSISSACFSSPTPQFVTPLLPTSSYRFGSLSPKEPGFFGSSVRNLSPFGYSKVASKGINNAHSNNVSPKRTASPSSKKNKKNDESAILSAIEKIQNGILVMVILRGLPGSGKSTLAKRLKFSGVLFSTDDYFYNRGKYVFDATKLSEAHAWNRRRTLKALQKGTTPIIIDNTNVEAWEFAPYVAMGKRHQYDILILEPNTPWKFKVHDLSIRNKHGVPKEKIAHMKERYQHNVTVENIMKSIEFSNLQTEELMENQFSFSKSKMIDERKANSSPLKVQVHHSQEHSNSIIMNNVMAKTPDSANFVGEHILANISENSKSSFLPEDYASSKILKDDTKSSDIDGNVKRSPCKENGSSILEELENQVLGENENAYNEDDNAPSSISNLDELRALIREDSEDSQSQSTSSLDISCWKSITELDDDFEWSTETDSFKNDENTSEITIKSEEIGINDLSENVQDKPLAKFEEKDMNVSIKNSGSEAVEKNMVKIESDVPKNLSKLSSAKRKKFKAASPLKIEDSVSLESNSSWENIEVKDLNKEIDLGNEAHCTPKPPRNIDASKTENKITNSESSFNLDSSSEKPSKSRLCANFNQSLNLSLNEWQFPKYNWSDVSPVECEKESSVTQKDTHSSQTEPKDFVMVHKASVGEPVSEDYFILETKLEFDVDDSKTESLDQPEIVAQNPTFEKSTYTEDLLEDVEVNEKLAHLQECFPDISDEDLLHLLEVCHNDDTWLSNLLLEWGYKYNVKTPVQTPQKMKPIAKKSYENDIERELTDDVIAVETSLVEVVPAVDDNVVCESSANIGQDVPFEKLRFVLDPSFAAQLEALFGPVKKQSQKNCRSAADRVVEIDLSFAELIYKNWKETVLSREKLQRCSGVQAPTESSSAVPFKADAVDIAMKERDSNEPLPLSEIMDMEYALQIHRKEKLQRDTDFSTKLKRLELYDLFPGADPLALDEIFEHNNFNLKDTVTALDLDFDQPNTEVQDKTIKKMDECLEKWRQNDVFREFALGDWSDWVFKENSLDSMEDIAFSDVPPSMPPEAAELREIATHHYHQRQECIKKAQAAYCKGMKDVASFYAQQGDEHGQKLKEANKRASEVISKQRSNGSSLVLDLHGLYVQEAIPALEKFLRDRKLELRRRQQTTPQVVSVITGQGIHSMRGPKILPSVIAFLKKAGYGFNESNRGMLEITLMPD